MQIVRKALRSIELRTLSSDRFLLALLVLYRTANAFLLTTYFEPDEMFQNLEPIPFALRRKGTPTWDWMLGIRSINYVLLYLVPSSVAYATESMFLGYATPRVVSGIVAGLADYFAVKTARLYAVDALAITLCSHGLWLYLPRSHINSFEALLGIAAFYFIEKCRRRSAKDKKPIARDLRAFLYLCTCGVFLRFSMLMLVIAPLIAYVVEQKRFFYVLRFVPELVLVVAALAISDSAYYGEPVFVPANFFSVNILRGVSDLFGTQPWYSHFFFAAVLLGIALPAFVAGAAKFRVISTSVALFFTLYSLVGHKEMRFLVPIIPLCNIVAAKSFRRFWPIYAGCLAIAVAIGMHHQNISSTIFAVQREIRKIDAENAHSKPIHVFLALPAYRVPTYPFAPHKRVFIKELGGNPDIFKKIASPKIYERFRDCDLVVNEDGVFFANVRRNIREFLDYDLIVMYRCHYEKVRDMMPNFGVASRNRFFATTLGMHTKIAALRTAKKLDAILVLKKIADAHLCAKKIGTHGAREAEAD